MLINFNKQNDVRVFLFKFVKANQCRKDSLVFDEVKFNVPKYIDIYVLSLCVWRASRQRNRNYIQFSVSFMDYDARLFYHHIRTAKRILLKSSHFEHAFFCLFFSSSVSFSFSLSLSLFLSFHAIVYTWLDCVDRSFHFAQYKVIHLNTVINHTRHTHPFASTKSLALTLSHRFAMPCCLISRKLKNYLHN